MRVVIPLYLYAKLPLAFPSAKYPFRIYEKYSQSLVGFEALDYIHKVLFLFLKVCSVNGSHLWRVL